MFGEGFGGEPAFILFPNDRWIQAFLDGRPDRKTGGKVITVNADIRAITNANFLNFVKEIILSIACKDIRHTRLYTNPHQGEQAFLFPIVRFLELIIAQLNPGLMEWIIRTRLR